MGKVRGCVLLSGTSVVRVKAKLRSKLAKRGLL